MFLSSGSRYRSQRLRSVSWCRAVRYPSEGCHALSCIVTNMSNMKVEQGAGAIVGADGHDGPGHMIHVRQRNIEHLSSAWPKYNDY